jgi:hypothetical protein
MLALAFRGKFGTEGYFTPSKMTIIVALHSPGFNDAVSSYSPSFAAKAFSPS